MMLCENPFVRTPTGIGKKHVILSEDGRLNATPFPCGQCLPCRINKSRVWKHRILLESMAYSRSCFLTLTYQDKFIPDYENLEKKDVQDFFKRLRKRIYPKRFRYFCVGEYGSDNNRPHYHLMLFGLDEMAMKDIAIAWSIDGEMIGKIDIGRCEENSAGYITKYTIKGWTDPKYNELKGRKPEFMLSSKGPPGGIGMSGVEKILEKKEKYKFYKKGIISELRSRHGNLPLGSYLTKKLSYGMGAKESELEDKFYNYQSEIFRKHLDCGKEFKESVVDEDDGKRRRMKRLNELFRKREKI